MRTTIYKHYKTGGLYIKLLECLDAETQAPLVVYRSEDTKRIWCRSKAEFEEEVTWPDGAKRRRFSLA